ncbi:MAG: hypothetical protein NXI32_04955 [bacterium]|nr:hypothetical protein [bacterium]
MTEAEAKRHAAINMALKTRSFCESATQIPQLTELAGQVHQKNLTASQVLGCEDHYLHVLRSTVQPNVDHVLKKLGILP